MQKKKERLLSGEGRTPAQRGCVSGSPGGYGIIVLDLDGTLTNRDKVITPRTRDALMEAQRRGKKVVLASGRPTQGVMPLAKE